VTTDWTTETKGIGEYADVNDIELYYETHGSGRPMILLHGGLGSGEILPGRTHYDIFASPLFAAAALDFLDGRGHEER
jgi:pimeloyl-ACP methyl ester carboxylesterase